MTLRANEIGADVYSTTETKLDKNNLGTGPQELEHNYDFPALAPGRALLDVENGDLYEIMHRVTGFTDTVEGRQSESEEYFNWKYRTPEGQSWGGVIQHYFISYAKRQCPAPNTHGEIQTPLTRPDENSITDISPDAFEASVLLDDEETPRPFLLLERPEVTYEETMPGESYDILGWYDPSENAVADRINAMETIAHRFPDIAGVDYTTDISKTLTELGITVEWDDNAESSVIEIAPAVEDDGLVVDADATAGNFHVTGGHAHEEKRFIIDSPFDAKDDIKAMNTARWAPDLAGGDGRWTLKRSHSMLVDMIRELTNDGWTLTIDADVFAAHADTDVSVTPDEKVEIGVSDIFEYAFTETVEVGTGLSIPGIDTDINTNEITTDTVALMKNGDSIEVVEAAGRGVNHAVSLTDEKFGFDCPKQNAGIVKSLNWKDARYEWNNGHWLVNTSTATDLIAAFIENNKSVTVSMDILAALGDEAPITEDQHVTIDNDAATHLDQYAGPDQQTDASDVTSLSGDSETDAHTVFGTSVSETNAPSLMTLDMTLANTDGGMSVDIGGADLPGLPESVKDEWQPSADSEDAEYGWFHPLTSARVTVQETEGWGTEYDIYVATPDQRDPEQIVTVADERTAALTAMTHLKAMTR
jgi:hypothetical protein